jgi:hypothetical protein
MMYEIQCPARFFYDSYSKAHILGQRYNECAALFIGINKNGRSHHKAMQAKEKS